MIAETRPWPRWNVRVTAVFGVVLIATGLMGLFMPTPGGVMSNAVPYDVFHIAFGMLALAIARGRQPVPAALFNLGFGLIDLWQAVAGVAGLFPARLFALRPGDHVVHLVLGLALLAVGGLGLRRPGRQ